jgi:peroxiredoxin
MTRIRSLLSLAIVLALSPPTVAAPPVLREAPELTVTDLEGQKQDLSMFKGQVVVIEFLLIRCNGCLRMAQMMNKLHGEMAGRGFLPIGVVFDNDISAPVIRDLANLLKLNYPVGYTTSDQVDRYLKRAMTVRFQTPQVVVIDRTGAIRAQSRPSGETNLTDETYLRDLIRELLVEEAPAGKSE